MHPQYIAACNTAHRRSDAAVSQPGFSKSASYLLAASSRIFGGGYTQVANPQNTWGIRMLSGISRVKKTYRRLTCLRASKAFAPYPCLPSWQHAATQATSKNSWSLTQSQSALSRLSTANTTKVVDLFLGQAFAPVPRHHQPLNPFDMEAA